MGSKFEELAVLHQETATNIELLKALRNIADLFIAAMEAGLYRNKDGRDLLVTILDNNESTKVAIDKYQKAIEDRFREMGQEEDKHE